MIDQIISTVNSQSTAVKITISVLAFILCIVVFFTCLGLVVSFLVTIKRNLSKLAAASYNYAYSMIRFVLGFVFGIYCNVSYYLKSKSDSYYKGRRSAPQGLENIQTEKRVSSHLTKAEVPIWEKYPPNIRSFDGHYVRSKAEVLIDDWLFHNKIFHITEKRIPGHDEIYCDFYLPDYDAYIEYWGLNNKEYLDKKEWKKNIYKNQRLRLIEIEDTQTKDIDHYLSVRISELKIQVLKGIKEANT